MKKEIVFIMICTISLLLVSFVSAQKLSIQIERSHNDVVNFKITIYDDNNNKIDGEANYIIQDYYGYDKGTGKADSGEEISFELPKDPSQGTWKINATYKDKSISELFNVGDIKRADIRLEGDNLIIENTGNIAYDNKILITIGDIPQSQTVYLAVGETRTLRLTAPAGEYTVKVDDGTGESNLVFNGVSLTGNVIGLENITKKDFWQRYGMIIVFLTILFVVSITVSLRIKRMNYKSVKGKKK